MSRFHEVGQHALTDTVGFIGSARQATRRLRLGFQQEFQHFNQHEDVMHVAVRQHNVVVEMAAQVINWMRSSSSN